MPKLTVTYYDDEGGEGTLTVPARYEVCPRCYGEGVHDHPAFSNGISQDQFDEDPDFEEAYHQGVYDVRCEECDGKRVVLVANEDVMTSEQLSAYRSAMNDLYEERLEREAQLRWGY